jgi:hypothetical protein
MVQQQISQHIDRLLMNCRVAVKYNIILIHIAMEIAGSSVFAGRVQEGPSCDSKVSF